MNKHLAKIKLFDPQQMMKVAAKYTTVFTDRVTDRAEDGKGKKLPEYSEGYRKLIEKGFRKKDGTRYKGYGGYSLALQGKIANRPFRLRGLTMRNFKARKADSDSFSVGWTGNPALIVQGNKENGRDIISDIPDREYKWILKQLGVAIDKEWKKVKNVNITVG